MRERSNSPHIRGRLVFIIEFDFDNTKDLHCRNHVSPADRRAASISSHGSAGFGCPCGRPRPQVLVDTGLMGLRLPESLGGSGATAIEGVLFAEEIGTSTVPGHIMASALVTPAALRLMEDAGKEAGGPDSRRPTRYGGRDQRAQLGLPTPRDLAGAGIPTRSSWYPTAAG